MRVLEVIVGFVAQGKIHPSYAAIARVARCSLDTVRVAITRLRAAGLLSWVILGTGTPESGASHAPRTTTDWPT